MSDCCPDGPDAQARLGRCQPDDLFALAARAHRADQADGENLVHELDPSLDLLVIASGSARVLKRGATSDEHEINQPGAGDSIGEMALFDRVSRSASVNATATAGRDLRVLRALPGTDRPWRRAGLAGTRSLRPLAPCDGHRGRQHLHFGGAPVRLYVSPGLAVTAFVAGLFWRWQCARLCGLTDLSVWHVLLGFWAFRVVDLGVLE